MSETANTAVETVNKREITVKPLSENAFVAFWQKIWRWWLGVWYNFADKHPKGAKLIYQIFFFVVFSQGVTIFQFLVFIIMPHILGIGLAGTQWLFPGVELTIFGVTFPYSFLGEVVAKVDDVVVIGGGLGFTISYWTGTFLAQCINLPLQRNITFKSNGNFWYQAMWYFIGWVLLSLVTGAFKGIWKPLLNHWWGAGSIWVTLVDTVVMGGVAMIIFYFIFLVIFPDPIKTAESTAKKAEAKKAELEQVKATGDKVAIEKAQIAYNKAQEKATKAEGQRKIFIAKKEISAAESLANAKAVAYVSIKNSLNKAIEEKEIAVKNNDSAKIEELQKVIDFENSRVKQAYDVAVSTADAFDKVNAEQSELMKIGEQEITIKA